MSNLSCPTCGAHWVNEQLYWSTGKPGKDEDLNALVCRRLTGEKASRCINPKKGADGGIGWEERASIVDSILTEFDL